MVVFPTGRETGRDRNHVELIACGGTGGLMKCWADAGSSARIWATTVRGPDVFAPPVSLSLPVVFLLTFFSLSVSALNDLIKVEA